MPEHAECNLLVKQVRVVIDKATDEVLARAAYRILERAQPGTNLDTGFLRNSGFVVLANGTSGYSQAKAAAESVEGYSPTAQVMAPESGLGDARAYVAFGAHYAIWQEHIKSYLFPAAQATAAEMGAIAQPIYAEQIGGEG